MCAWHLHVAEQHGKYMEIIHSCMGNTTKRTNIELHEITELQLSVTCTENLKHKTVEDRNYGALPHNYLFSKPQITTLRPGASLSVARHEGGPP